MTLQRRIQPITVEQEKKAYYQGPIGVPPLQQRTNAYVRWGREANECTRLKWPMGGGVSAAIRRLLPLAAGRSPGLEPEYFEKVSVEEGTEGAPFPPTEVIRKDVAGERRGTGRVWHMNRSTCCLGTGRCPAGACHGSYNSQQG